MCIVTAASRWLMLQCTGIADDKAVYAFVPQIIKYYLGEDIILPNVPSFVCGDPVQCEHVLANLDKLVVKPANESGGYGIVLGPELRKKNWTIAASRSWRTHGITLLNRCFRCRGYRRSCRIGSKGGMSICVPISSMAKIFTCFLAV